MRKGKGVLKRSAAAVLSAAMVFSMNFSALPAVAHAQSVPDPGGTGTGQNESREVKIGLDEIASMTAKTLGPTNDGDTLEASFDGDTTTYTNSNYTDPSNSKPQVYTFTFDEQVNLCKVRIHPRNAGGGVGNGAPNSCLVEVSADGSSYIQTADQAVTDNSLTWTDISFSAVPAKSVRLTLNSAHETVVSTGEVELYKLIENPEQPDPADKTGLKEAIDRVVEKMAGLNEEDYVISSWNALETALSNAQTVYENEGASANDVAAALSALETAEKNLAELISPIYMTDFVSCENGRVTVELNGPTNYVPDGSTEWIYEYRDGRHLLYTDNWDTAALASGETKNYRAVCIYDMNGTDGEGTWSFVYLSDDGAGSVSTEYGNRPVATITAGGKTYDLSKNEDKTEIAGLKFTAAPVVHVSGVDLRGAESQRTGVGESAIDAGAVVSPDRTEMEFPIKSQTGKPASGNYSLYISWHGTTAYFWNIQINNVNVIDRSALEEAIAGAEGLTADDYTEESWAAMQQKLEEAREVLDDVIATTSEVSEAAQELNDAVAALEDKVPPADKTELQQLYNEVKDAVFTYPNTTFCDRFTDALADAADILENDAAIQEDVDSAYYYLEKYYWLNMVNDKVSYYNPDKSGQDGRFVYSDKITESILPLVTAFKAARYANVNTEPDILKGYYEGFTEAEKHEAEIADPDLRGVEVGFNAENDFDTETALNSNNYGHFEITGQEFVSDAAGNVSVKVFIRFVNDGISPVTGEEGDDYSVSEMTKARCRVAYEAPSQKGSKSISGKDKLNGSYGNGFIGEVTVPLDSVISLTVEDSVMPGFFKVQKFAEADKTELETAISAAEALDEENYTEESWAAVQEKLETAKNVLDNVLATQTEVDDAADALNNAMEALVPDTDKAALQKLYDEVKDAQFDYPYQSYYKGFTNALNRAQTVLEDEMAFQSEVDTAYNTLEKYYWLNMLNDKVAYYNPDKEGEDGRFIYSDKLTESILPVVAAFQEGSNVSSGASTEKILTCYNAFVDAEKLIQTAESDLRGTEVGFNADAMDPDNYGHFEITGQEFVVGEDGVVRVKVSFKFVNDGIDPISGEQGKPFSLSDMGDLSCRVAYESPSETGSKGVDYQGPLDGNIKNGIEGYFTVDQDSAVNLYFYRTAYMPGYYRVQKFEEADKSALEAVVSEAEALIDAQKVSGMYFQAGSQGMASLGNRKARQLVQSGIIGKVNFIDGQFTGGPGTLGRYPVPEDASEKTIWWKQFLGNAPKHKFEPQRFFYWRNWKDYGTGIAGDLYVHVLASLHFITGAIGPEKVYTTGGIRYYTDGFRDTPDIMLGYLDYPDRNNIGAFTVQLGANYVDGVSKKWGSMDFRIVGSAGTLDVGWNSVTLKTMRKVDLGQLNALEKIGGGIDTPVAKSDNEVVFNVAPGYKGGHYDHFNNFFTGIRNKTPIDCDVMFAVRSAAPALLSYESYERGEAIYWDPENLKEIKKKK